VSVRTTRSISISVGNELGCRYETKKQAMVKGVPEVAEDALHHFEVGLTRVVHVKTHLVDCVIDVRLSEGEVLKDLYQAVVGSQVAHKGAVQGL
jgi:hypothetical protein